MKAAYLLNPSARAKKTAAKLTFLVQSKPSLPSELFIVDRTQPGSLESHLASIAKSDFDKIIIGGGDGTLNRCINFLASKNLLDRYVFGVIPLGTCNDFAKILGFRKSRALRRNVRLALEMVERNSVREISIAKVNDHYFLNNAGFGRRNPSQKKRNPISDLRALRPVPTLARWDNQSADGSFLMMLAANAPYFSDGLHFSLDSDPADALLEFFFVRDIGKFRLFTKLFLGARGLSMMRSKRRDSAILKVKASELTIQTKLPVWIMADGEVVSSLSGVREARFSIGPKARFLTA